MIRRLLDLLAGKPSAARSPQWPAVEKAHLKEHPGDVLTGETKGVEVHHVYPAHLFPERELDPTNLRTVTRHTHFLFGHGRDWKAFNENFDTDIAKARQMIQARKYTR